MLFPGGALAFQNPQPTPLLRHGAVGANAGYALGALVLGQRLRELSPQVERLLLHTDDVPSNYLEVEKWGKKPHI